jgi:hypothetical protein
MAIEVATSNAICSRCGTMYGRRRGNFSVNYGALYKGTGYLTTCKDCVDNIFTSYMEQTNDPRKSTRQVCRKLDLYWSDKIYDWAEKKSTDRTIMTGYLAKLNTANNSGKSYDDTLIEECSLWSDNLELYDQKSSVLDNTSTEDYDCHSYNITDEIKAFWGPGYTDSMYDDLEQRRTYWMSKFPEGIDIDIGTEALIRQICNLEIDINRDRAAGKSIDKSVNALNNLLGSASLKPTQKKDESDISSDNTPFGVWIKRWENQRPIPEPDPSLKDVDGIVKYIEVWFKGHLSKMLKLKNSYSQMYEKEISKMRVEHPEYDDDDDETLFNDVFGDDLDES